MELNLTLGNSLSDLAYSLICFLCRLNRLDICVLVIAFLIDFAESKLTSIDESIFSFQNNLLILNSFHLYCTFTLTYNFYFISSIS